MRMKLTLDARPRGRNKGRGRGNQGECKEGLHGVQCNAKEFVDCGLWLVPPVVDSRGDGAISPSTAFPALRQTRDWLPSHRVAKQLTYQPDPRSAPPSRLRELQLAAVSSDTSASSPSLLTPPLATFDNTPSAFIFPRPPGKDVRPLDRGSRRGLPTAVAARLAGAHRGSLLSAPPQRDARHITDGGIDSVVGGTRTLNEGHPLLYRRLEEKCVCARQCPWHAREWGVALISRSSGQFKKAIDGQQLTV